MCTDRAETRRGGARASKGGAGQRSIGANTESLASLGCITGGSTAIAIPRHAPCTQFNYPKQPTPAAETIADQVLTGVVRPCQGTGMLERDTPMGRPDAQQATVAGWDSDGAPSVTAQPDVNTAISCCHLCSQGTMSGRYMATAL